MKHKPTNEFTEDERNWMDTLAVNYIIAQSDGFQLGYAQAIGDFTESILDYWKGSDDEPQHSVLDAIVDLGVELRKRQEVVEKNIATAKERKYERYYNWQYKEKDEHFRRTVRLFVKFESEEGGEE